MELIKVKDYDAMSEEACAFLVERINRIENPVLGLATGSTPEGLYKRIIEKYNQNEVSFKKVKSFNLDEYVGLEKEDPNSYYYFMKDKLFDHVDISLDNVRVPNGVAADLKQECEAHEAGIKAAGGIDVQLLGIGANGHIGFNEPGTPFTSKTQVVDLEQSTIEANARFFNSIEEVPTQAISMGIETIMNSNEILLLVSGENKADALAKLINGEVTEDVPASVLQNHANVTIIADEAALSVVNGK
ncbi:glucosamine-6-phosphate deaminase [Oceanobacillus sp. 143]|uniref:Glucosamine-6-phosphate deaminase n=1 Tax=Oceanobacillus zhaokaii TaxID=2052660 RepID=A0A345PKK8_9BACI|nr:glucosamine-6-phosphate deaminase [Oceanobacillus zhaokaii]AXI10538.1 glucosamine-6-phosphate deaminase [Oceanobacillus zhaokaii]QGS69520.1 glucosamine-6-phosphate deaminase [Oceanobacillus sp. 143]